MTGALVFNAGLVAINATLLVTEGYSLVFWVCLCVALVCTTMLATIKAMDE
jgi:hypothetical protein